MVLFASFAMKKFFNKDANAVEGMFHYIALFLCTTSQIRKKIGKSNLKTEVQMASGIIVHKYYYIQL